MLALLLLVAVVLLVGITRGGVLVLFADVAVWVWRVDRDAVSLVALAWSLSFVALLVFGRVRRRVRRLPVATRPALARDPDLPDPDAMPVEDTGYIADEFSADVGPALAPVVPLAAVRRAA